MGLTWNGCEGPARTEVAARCSGYRFQNALQAVADYWLAVVNGDHSNPEKYAKTVQCFLACLELTSKLWNDNARKFWPTDKRVAIGKRTGNSTAVAAMEYFHDVARVLSDGPMADCKAYGDNDVSREQLKHFKQSMTEHFSSLGVPAKPGDVMGILDNIELNIGTEADVARSTQASIAFKRLEHLRQLFLQVNEDSKLLKAAMVEGGMMLVPLIELGSIPNNEVLQDQIDTARKKQVPHFDTSLADFCHCQIFRLVADIYSDKRRSILHKLSDNGEGISCWSTSHDDTREQSHQYASFCAELVEYLEQQAPAIGIEHPRKNVNRTPATHILGGLLGGCIKCGKPLEQGISGFRCDFCTRTSEKLIGLQLAMHRKDLDDVELWPNIRAKLKQKFGFGRTKEQLIEDLVDHVKLVKDLDESAALNIPLAEVVNMLDSKPAIPTVPLSVDQPEVAAPAVNGTHPTQRKRKTRTNLAVLRSKLDEAINDGYQYETIDKLTHRFGGSVGSWSNIINADDALKAWTENQSVQAAKFADVHTAVEDQEYMPDDEMEKLFEDSLKKLPDKLRPQAREQFANMEKDKKQRYVREYC